MPGISRAQPTMQAANQPRPQAPFAFGNPTVTPFQAQRPQNAQQHVPNAALVEAPPSSITSVRSFKTEEEMWRLFTDGRYLWDTLKKLRKPPNRPPPEPKPKLTTAEKIESVVGMRALEWFACKHSKRSHRGKGSSSSHGTSAASSDIESARRLR